MTEPSDEKPLRPTSFVIHATRGVIRDQTLRRKAMFVLLVVAMVILFSGSTFLAGTLRRHPVWFVLFWLACGWLTLTAMLLAIFDLLVVRAQARKVEKLLHRELSETRGPDSTRDVQ